MTTGNYFEARSQIRNGDLIAVKGRGAFAAAIRWITESEYSHTGIAVWFGSRLLVAETRGGVAAFSPLSQHVGEDFDVFDCPVPRILAEQAAESMLGAPIRYDYLDILRLAAHELAGWPLPNENGQLVCSALSGAIYLHAGWSPIGLPSIPTPRDIVAALCARPRLSVTATPKGMTMKTFRTTLAALAISAFALIAGFACAPACAGSLTDYGENKLVDNLIRGQANTLPATYYPALGTNACSDAGSPTEPSGNGYARPSIASSLANWAGTQSAASTVASSGTGGTTSNNVVITYATSTGAWAAGANLVSVWFMDASSAGNAWICITLTAPIAVSGSGFTLSFPAASLSFQIDN